MLRLAGHLEVQHYKQTAQLAQLEVLHHDWLQEPVPKTEVPGYEEMLPPAVET